MGSMAHQTTSSTRFHDPATGRPHGDDPQDPGSFLPGSWWKNMENPMENPVLTWMIAGGSHIFLGNLHEKLIWIIKLGWSLSIKTLSFTSIHESKQFDLNIKQAKLKHQKSYT